MAQKTLLWVPKTVSFNTRSKFGYQSKGTRAFVSIGTRLPKGLSPVQKQNRLAELAETAQFFTKPNGQRVQLIRQKLQSIGIIVEEPIQDLGNGRALFRKSGYSLESRPGIRQFVNKTRDVVEKICETVGKMHANGITHGHLHMGNIGITKNGKIILFDINRAKFTPSGMNNVGPEITELTTRLTSLYSWGIETFQKRTPTKKEIRNFENYVLSKILYYSIKNLGEYKVVSWKTFEKRFQKCLPEYRKRVYRPQLFEV